MEKLSLLFLVFFYFTISGANSINSLSNTLNFDDISSNKKKIIKLFEDKKNIEYDNQYKTLSIEFINYKSEDLRYLLTDDQNAYEIFNDHNFIEVEEVNFKNNKINLRLKTILNEKSSIVINYNSKEYNFTSKIYSNNVITTDTTFIKYELNNSILGNELILNYEDYITDSLEIILSESIKIDKIEIYNSESVVEKNITFLSSKARILINTMDLLPGKYNVVIYSNKGLSAQKVIKM